MEFNSDDEVKFLFSTRAEPSPLEVPIPAIVLVKSVPAIVLHPSTDWKKIWGRKLGRARISKPSRVTLNKTRLRFKYHEDSAARRDAKGKLRTYGYMQMVGVKRNAAGEYHPVFLYPTAGEISKATMKNIVREQDCAKIVDQSRAFTDQELQQLHHHFSKWN